MEFSLEAKLHGGEDSLKDPTIGFGSPVFQKGKVAPLTLKPTPQTLKTVLQKSKAPPPLTVNPKT